MVKWAFAILCMAIAANNAYAAANEGTLALGIAYQNTTNLSGDFVQAAGGSIGMVGLSVNAMGFWNNRNIGLFVNGNWLMAVYLSNRIDLQNYGNFYMGGIIGPGFRHSVSDKLTLLAGAGIDFHAQLIRAELINNTVYEDYSLDLGLGGQAGFKLDITDIVCIKFLLNTSYIFINCIGNSLQWPVKSTIVLNPFIGIGFNWYDDSQHWGKP
jgi:hypothetical protein